MEEFNPPLTSLPPQSDPTMDSGAELVRWLFPAYVLLILSGFFILRSNWVMPAGNELNPDRAIFTSINAATLTGFQLSIHPSRFFTLGKVFLLILTVAGTLFSLVVGGLAVKRILRLPWPDRRIVSATLMIEVFVLIIGAIASGRSEEGALGGMLQAAAAWGNSGLYIGTPPAPSDLFTHIVLLPLAVFGGLGITVVIEIFDALVNHRPLSRHARIVIQWTAGLYLAGLIVFSLVQLLDLEAIGQRQSESWLGALGRFWPGMLSHASILSANVRTAGMAILPVYSLPRGMVFFAMVLMVIGASPGGAGGGLKTTTLHELITGPYRLLKGQGASRALGIAATWMGLYLLAGVIVQTLLLTFEPQLPGDRVLFITLSALSNVGLSHDVLSMTRVSLLLVSVAMLFGRLAPLLVLWWMVDTTRDADVAVG